MRFFARATGPLVVLIAAGCGGGNPPVTLPPTPTWAQLPPLPDREGFASPFAGVSGGHLLVAGGANFPDKRPWEGGTKVWYDTVYALDRPDDIWKAVGKLPRPLGYGISATVGNAVYCFGGSDATRHYPDGFKLTLKDGKLETTPLPRLPKPCANAAWAVAGSTLVVVGGTETPTATECLNTVWDLRLDDPNATWHDRSPFPGRPRMLAVAGGIGSDIYVFSGTSLHAGPDGKPVRSYLTDAWQLNSKHVWTQLPDLPRAAVAAPSPAPVVGGKLWIVGGDDASKVGFKPETEHPGFPRDVLAFDPATAAKWKGEGTVPFSRVTAPFVEWRGCWVIPSGEARPGYRSPEVWALTP